MYKLFFIFLFLCFCGIGASYAVGEINSNLDNNQVLAMIDVDAEGERNLNDLLKLPPELDGPDYMVTLAFALVNSEIVSGKESCATHLYGNNRGKQRPLFLLYHSFLFYDLLF